MGTRSILQCVTKTIQLVDLCSRLRIISPSLPCFTPLASKSDNHYGQRDLGAKFRRSAEREGNQRITAERERRRKERRMREAEGEAGSASAGRQEGRLDVPDPDHV